MIGLKDWVGVFLFVCVVVAEKGRKREGGGVWSGEGDGWVLLLGCIKALEEY